MTELTPTSRRPALRGIDRFLSQVDQRLRQLAGHSVSSPEGTARPSPAIGHEEPRLSAGEREHAAGLMRVNHTGEVCAQALYQGQALAARSDTTRDKLLGAAQEEADHLAWCEARLQELDAEPSKLNPLFYAASFALGAATALAGDKVSLGFVHATEERVAGHLRAHLKALPGERPKVATHFAADADRRRAAWRRSVATRRGGISAPGQRCDDARQPADDKNHLLDLRVMP